jgi:isopenicillin N synthase-like dioxygenase
MTTTTTTEEEEEEQEEPPPVVEPATEEFATDVPVIDLLHTDHDTLVPQIAAACRTPGFFQVLQHGIDPELIVAFRAQCRAYFTTLDPSVRERSRRHEHNARGFFDKELTQQRRDWKYALDVGRPGSRSWDRPDDDPANGCLDGYNQFPTESELPGFRDTVISYFEACAGLAHRLTVLMTEGIHSARSGSAAQEGFDIVTELQQHHTSYLRLNYYPPCPAQEDGAPPPLGISPHRDAGFLTVLLQDDDCHSLQVPLRDPPTVAEWRTVVPIPGALTINTGDMAQIWSQGRYRAPWHRVRTHGRQARYSAPFFYNPGYHTWLPPLPLPATMPPPPAEEEEEAPRYHPCLWGYFRAVRFAGDLTDLGVEIQVQDFLCTTPSPHQARQQWFAEQVRVDEPFSVERFRQFLLMEEKKAASEAS